MPDLDTELRALALALVDEAPLAPRYEDLSDVVRIPQPSGPRPLARVLVAAAVVLLVVAIVVALAITTDTSTTQPPADPPAFVPCEHESPGTFVGPNGKTFGPMPNIPGPFGQRDIDELVPDYIPVTCREGNGIGGYVRKTDLFAEESPVFADDGETVVGHMYNGKGFVALDEDPDSVPDRPSSTVVFTAPRN